MVKIALTGSSGLVGSRIVELLKNEFTFIPITQDTCDITVLERVNKVIKNIDFDIFLHLAAYTNVDGAEKEKETAYKINVEGTKNVFSITTEKNKKFIYVSTDFVFDGTMPPYFEDSKPAPISTYGETKYEGEKIVQGSAMIVRLSYPYRAVFEPKKDFVRSIKSNLEQQKTLSMVRDSVITPTFIDDIVFALRSLFMNFSNEVFHIVGSSSLTPYDAGLLIAKTFNLDVSLIQPTTYDEYFKNKAKRPQYSEIKSKKNTFYKMSSFDEGLKKLKIVTI